MYAPSAKGPGHFFIYFDRLSPEKLWTASSLSTKVTINAVLLFLISFSTDRPSKPAEGNKEDSSSSISAKQ